MPLYNPLSLSLSGTWQLVSNHWNRAKEMGYHSHDYIIPNGKGEKILQM